MFWTKFQANAKTLTAGTNGSAVNIFTVQTEERGGKFWAVSFHQKDKIFIELQNMIEILSAV